MLVGSVSHVTSASPFFSCVLKPRRETGEILMTLRRALVVVCYLPPDDGSFAVRAREREAKLVRNSILFHPKFEIGALWIGVRFFSAFSAAKLRKPIFFWQENL